jgi:hypothetical protein
MGACMDVILYYSRNDAAHSNAQNPGLNDTRRVHDKPQHQAAANTSPAGKKYQSAKVKSKAEYHQGGKPRLNEATGANITPMQEHKHCKLNHVPTLHLIPNAI